LVDSPLRKFSQLRQFGARQVGNQARRLFKSGPAPHLPDGDLRQIRQQIDASLSSRVSVVSARMRAAELGATYLTLDDTGRKRFFGLLIAEYGIDRAHLATEVARWQTANTAEDGDAGDDRLSKVEAALRQALQPPRVALFTLFNALDEGIKFLVDLRADLRSYAREDPRLAVLDAELRTLLTTWFDVGLLELRRITWDTPASLLERLIAYEAVHEIESWGDLKNRLDSDRRLYGFFHPGMPDEPLIFVEIALVNGLATQLGPLLDLDAPEADAHRADTAIFYSISNCQTGLAGVNLGDHLIKQVVTALISDLPGLSQFATLSPVPGFRSWLEKRVADNDLPLHETDLAQLSPIAATPSMALSRALTDPHWIEDSDYTAAIKRPLVHLCAEYLLGEKDSAGRTLDRVANFHLSNGARLEQINFAANETAVGLDRALGLMVNYRYELDAIDANHEGYVIAGQVPRSPSVDRLIRPA